MVTLQHPVHTPERWHREHPAVQAAHGITGHSKWQTCWFIWCVLELLPTSFKWVIVIEMRYSKICVLLVHGRSKVMNECVSQTVRTVGSWSRSFYEGYHWWWELVLRLRPGDEAAIKSMKAFNLTTSQKRSTWGEIQCHDDANLCFQCTKDCPEGICSSWPNCESDILLGSSEVFRKYEGQVKSGSFIITMCLCTSVSVRLLLAKNGMTPLIHPPYSPDIALVTFLSLSNKKKNFTVKTFTDAE